MSIVDNLDPEELIKIITDDNTPDRILMEIASDSETPPFLQLYLLRRPDLSPSILDELIDMVNYRTPDKILLGLFGHGNLTPENMLRLASKNNIEFHDELFKVILNRPDIFSENMAGPLNKFMSRFLNFRKMVAKNPKAPPRVLDKVIDYVLDYTYPLTSRNILLQEVTGNPNLSSSNIKRIVEKMETDLLEFGGINLTFLALNKSLTNELFEDLLNLGDIWDKMQLIDDYWDSSFVNKLHLSPDPEIREAYINTRAISFDNLIYLLDDPDRSVRQAATNVVLDDIAEYPKEIQERLLPVIKRNSDTKLKEDFPNLSLKSDASNKNHPDLELLKRLKGHLNSHA